MLVGGTGDDGAYRFEIDAHGIDGYSKPLASGYGNLSQHFPTVAEARANAQLFAASK